MKKLLFLIIFMLAFHTPVFACQFDTDCEVGSKCLKGSSSLYGVCVGGLNPGNRYDRQPVYDSLDLNRG